jgi:PAS domain S-box-containing protein
VRELAQFRSGAQLVDSAHSHRLIVAASEAVNTLFVEGSRLKTLQQALSTIAHAVDVDRISLIEFSIDTEVARTIAHHRFDWRSDAPDRLINDPDTASMEIDASLAFWSQPQSGNEVIVTQTIEASQEIRERLEGWGVQTVVSMPIALSDGFRGVLNFVHRNRAHAWTPEDLVALETISHVLATACLRYDTDTRLETDIDLSREAFDGSTVGMSILGADGTMLEVNDALCAMLGYAREQLIGQNSLILAHQDDIPLVHNLRQEILALEITDAERRFVRSDGESIWTQCNIYPIRSRSDSTRPNRLTFVAQVRDITAIRQAGVIADLERSNRELEQFAYVASHDLQEPLRMITSYLELLQRRYADSLDEDANDFINFAVDGATRMRALVTSLLIYSRLDSGAIKYVPVSLSTALERALHSLELLIDENDVRITYGELPTVNGDEGQLTQVFQNLFENAIKFSAQAPPEIHVSATPGPGFWTIAVRDNGIGFEANQAERIFGVFRRLHNYGQYPGTGIGLAICKRIIERHGGSIKAFSDVGIGSTFQFTLPVINT